MFSPQAPVVELQANMPLSSTMLVGGVIAHIGTWDTFVAHSCVRCMRRTIQTCYTHPEKPLQLHGKSTSRCRYAVTVCHRQRSALSHPYPAIRQPEQSSATTIPPTMRADISIQIGLVLQQQAKVQPVQTSPGEQTT